MTRCAIATSVILTPHVAGLTAEAQVVRTFVINDVLSVLAGGRAIGRSRLTKLCSSIIRQLVMVCGRPDAARVRPNTI